MRKIILKGSIQVLPEELEIVRAALPEHIANTRAEAGCLVFEVTEDRHHIGRFNVYEESADKRAFALHQARVKASAWGALTTRVTRDYQIFEAKEPSPQAAKAD